MMLTKLTRRLGLTRGAPPAPDPVEALVDLPQEDRDTIRSVLPYTMTSVERVAALVNAIHHVSQSGLPGDIVECGVWRGGSMMAVAQTLVNRGDTNRTLYLFDTFEGMSAPTDDDRTHDGQSAEELLDQDAPGTGIWCYASLEDVRRNLLSTGYPEDRIVFVKGKVEDTIPKHQPDTLAVLRLDTDWYESTRHELFHLYPRLAEGGILIIDDYGHWQGARAAVDEYVRELPYPLYLHRIDYTGRIAIKPRP